MKRFLKGLFDFFWPYFAAGILAGTLLALIYGLGGYIKFSVEPNAWDWIKIWFTFCAVLTAFCTVMSIILDIIGFVLFVLGYLAVAFFKRMKAK